MKLHPPFEISSRLLPSIKVGDGTISLECVGVKHNRLAWRWFADIPAGEFSASDLYGGAWDTDNAEGTQRTFVALLSFLSACAEGIRYGSGENYMLFPAAVGAWAAENSDEIGSLKCQLDETPSLLEDEK